MNFFEWLLHSLTDLFILFFEWVLSEKSSGLMTLLTVITAYALYKHQKNSFKEDAAKTIYLELLEIERNVEELKSTKAFSLLDKEVINNNSWRKYSHLFAKNLSQREIEVINKFYSKATIAQKLIEKIHNIMDQGMDEKARSFQRQFLDDAVKTQKVDKKQKNLEYENNKSKWKKLIEDETYWFLPFTYEGRMESALRDIPLITLTNIGTKFAILANINNKEKTFLEKVVNLIGI